MYRHGVWYDVTDDRNGTRRMKFEQVQGHATIWTAADGRTYMMRGFETRAATITRSGGDS